MTRTWERTTEAGDTITVTIDALGAAVSIRRVTGAREGWAISHEEFEEEWLPWLAAPFDDVTGELATALGEVRQAADDLDDQEP